jgi:hypothetical protein
MGVSRERERVEVVEPARVDNLSFENRQKGRKGKTGDCVLTVMIIGLRNKKSCESIS